MDRAGWISIFAILVLSACPALGQDEPAFRILAATDGLAPGVDEACFKGTRFHPPQVNDMGDVAFLFGLTPSNTGCVVSGRTGGSWVVRDGLYSLYTHTEPISCEPPCPLTDIEGPGLLHTYDDQVLRLGGNGDLVMFAKAGDLWGITRFRRDCEEDAECSTGMCDPSGACMCDSNADCPSGTCVGNYCKLRHENVALWTGPDPLGGEFVFGYPYEIEINAHGVVVFKANNSTGDGLAETGLWRQRPGEPVELIAIRGQEPPGMPGELLGNPVDFAVADDPSGSVVFHAKISGDDWIWSDRGGSLAPVASDRDSGQSGGLRLSDDQIVDIDETGQIVFAAGYGLIEGDPPGWVTYTGVYASPPGAGLGTTVAEFTTLGSDRYEEVSELKAVGGGAAWIETIDDAGVPTKRVMVGPTEVARQHAPLPRLPGDGDYVYFSEFSSLAANRAGQIAFIADARPDCAGLDQPACQEAFGCAFGSECAADSSAGPQALYIWSQAGGLNRVILTPAEVEVSPGDVRTAERLWIARNEALANKSLQTRPLNVGGKVCFMITFADGRGMGHACSKEPPLVVLRALEVNQSVQDWRNTVPLIEGKPTLVRAHFEASEPVGVRAVLRGYDAASGQELAGSPLRPDNKGGFATAPVDAQAVRRIAGRSLYYWLPKSWLTGSVRLKVELEDDLRLECRDAARENESDCQADVTFEPSEVPEFKFIRMRWQVAGQPVTGLPRGGADMMPRILEAMYPVAKVDRDYSAAWIGQVGGSRDRDPDMVTLNLLLWGQRLAEGCGAGCERIYFGALAKPISAGDVVYLGLAYGSVSPGNPWGGKVGAGVFDPVKYRSVHAHEIGHCLTLEHAVSAARFGHDEKGRPRGACGEVATPAAPEFPFFADLGGRPVATMGPVDADPDEQVFGFDSLRPLIIDPREHLALMSYCGRDEWVSRSSYPVLHQVIDERFGPHDPPAQPAEHMMVRGAIGAGGMTAELLPISGVDIEASAPAPGELTARLFAEDGRLLQEQAFSPMVPQVLLTEGATPDDVLDSMVFVLLFDADPDASRLEISDGTGVLLERTASQSPPSVQIVSPASGETLDEDTVRVEWTGTDPDGDELVYRLRYSPDGGQHWSVLALDWPENSIELDRHLLAGSDQAVFEVQATDGFRYASDATQEAISVADSPPTVSIEAPEEGEAFSDDDPIRLQAWTWDREDASIPEDQVVWTSDLDGQLAVGHSGQISAADLSQGFHTITVFATDSLDNVSSSERHIQVYDTAPADMSDVFVRLHCQPDPVGPDQPLTALIEVGSSGPRPATGVSCSLALPAGVDFGDASTDAGSCALASGAVECNLDDVGLDGLARIEISMTPTALGDLVFTVSAAGSGTDPLPANNQATTWVAVREGVAPPDAGVDGGDGGPDADGGQTPDGGGPPGDGDAGGCNCGARSHGSCGAVLGLLLLGLLLRGRRATRLRERSARGGRVGGGW